MRIPVVFMPILLVACAGSGEQVPGTVADADRAPPVTVVGEAQRCIQTGLIQNTDVHGSQIIDFRLRNGETWRSTLSAPCPGLATERRFAYESTVGQLCSRVDTIQVLYTGGGAIPGARCALGPFVPVEPIRANPDGTAG